ncbi:FAD-binding oxidoreductase [Roseomonas sp. KE0001]|uniref:NAD(P)/FAD-dependent oxidoreductase n=1 Tax=unclassified Roseomonas TaxID=2617492 RepID=UPI0018E03396|nr:FAD-binding oxidoreductase [Roseomonas sp. KE0001]MBI0435106.1 FAD-binding oxidoreductase [Roseomonas sp. KE0001]
MRIIVLGAGIFGASTAYHLAGAGAEVIILDEDHAGRATAAGAGIINPWSSEREDEAWYAMANASARAYPALIEELAGLGETQTSYGRVGAICAPADPAQLAATEARTRARAATVPEAGAITRLSAAEARALFPPLRPGQPALHIAGAARVDGRRLTEALRRAAVRRGATDRIAGVAALVSAGTRVLGVMLKDGSRLDADEVVLAAGAWAPPLLQPLGLRLAVVPQRGQIVHLRMEGQDTSAWPVLLPMSSHYLLAFGEGRVVVGATRETGSGFDHRLTAGGIAEVLNNALSVAPGLAQATLLETRIGFRPMGPDLAPLLGRPAGWEGLVIANGLGPGGLTMGPYAGKLAAQLALRQAPEMDLAPYDPLRGAA